MRVFGFSVGGPGFKCKLSHTSDRKNNLGIMVVAALPDACLHWVSTRTGLHAVRAGWSGISIL